MIKLVKVLVLSSIILMGSVILFTGCNHIRNDGKGDASTMENTTEKSTKPEDTTSVSTNNGRKVSNVTRSLKNEPFECMVTIGDSITLGMSATSRKLCWASRLASEISEGQGQDIKLYNVGISSNILSPRSPAYKYSAKPSGMERFEKDVIKHNPDLVVIAYGLNDLRGGTPVDVFIEDMESMVKEIKKSTNALIVLANVYFMRSFELEPGIWDHGSIEGIQLYNEKILEAAQRNDVLYADIYSAMNEAHWTLSNDGIHPNNLGHKLISNKLFEVIASNCNNLTKF